MRRVYDPRPTVHRELVQDRYHPQRGLDVYRVSVCHNGKAAAYGVGKVRRDGWARAGKVRRLRTLAYRMGVLLGPTKGLSVRAQRVIRHPGQRTAIEVARAKSRESSWKKVKPLRERALDIAARNVGLMERGSNNRGPGVERIIRYAGGDIGESWCVDFVIWCYGHAGSTKVAPGFTRAVRYMLVTGATEVTASPKPGDIVRYKFDHTGLFVQDNGDGTITAIEGNTGPSGAVSDSATGGDGVYRKVRDKSLVADYLQVAG